MTDDDGDPDIDPAAELADAALRDLLSDIPADAVVDPDRASMIEVAIATAWPEGVPPTLDELAHDPDFDALMAIPTATDASTDTDASDDTDDFVVPVSDSGDGVDAADDSGDDSDWESPDGSGEQG